MSIYPAFAQHLRNRFCDFFKDEVLLNNATAVHGGDINQCYLLDTSKGSYFLKVNASLFGLDFFEKEARGLLMLADTHTLKVPLPLFDGKFQQEVYLVMEYLEHGQAAPDFWQNFGYGLAALHKNTNADFGLSYDNYIGRLHQVNHKENNWFDFYAQHRIRNLAQKAYDRKLLTISEMEMAEKICRNLRNYIPVEPAALLHGDLWNGNFMATPQGAPAIFDPAVYYGHREMDIAMTSLFGGFSPAFYSSYHEAYPLAPGWQERIELLQLYPLMVHLLLFGGHYHDSVSSALKKFS